MSSTNDPERARWLDHERLKLAWIFNLARGLKATDRPFDLPQNYAVVFHDLKAAIDCQEIDSSPGSGRMANLDTKIKAADFGKFLTRNPVDGVREVWLALTDLQLEWAQVRGIDALPANAAPVADSERMPEASDVLNQEVEDQPNKVGRPSRRTEIRTAIDTLVAQKKIDLKRRASDLVGPIRQKVIQTAEDNDRSGLGNQVIRIVLREYLATQ